MTTMAEKIGRLRREKTAPQMSTAMPPHAGCRRAGGGGGRSSALTRASLGLTSRNARVTNDGGIGIVGSGEGAWLTLQRVSPLPRYRKSAHTMAGTIMHGLNTSSTAWARPGQRGGGGRLEAQWGRRKGRGGGARRHAQ